LALPRVRDFRGLSPDAFDGHGNYTLGLTEQLVFPDEVHSFLRHASWLRAYRAAAEFFAGTLGTREARE